MRYVLFASTHDAGRSRSYVMTIANRRARDVLRGGEMPAVAH